MTNAHRRLVASCIIRGDKFVSAECLLKRQGIPLTTKQWTRIYDQWMKHPTNFTAEMDEWATTGIQKRYERLYKLTREIETLHRHLAHHSAHADSKR
jgi:hypothetical protein